MEQFKNVYRRTHTRSVKWDMTEEVFHTEDILPMWVADMDFKAPQAVNEALIERAKHGIYGYTFIDEDIKKTVTSWLERRHNWIVPINSLTFSPSVMTSVHMAITAFTNQNDHILIQTPVYTPFYQAIEQHGRNVVKNKLLFNEVTNKYEIDFDDFEQKLANGVKAFLLCSPHNPVGRVWTKDELMKMAELCLKYNVLIFSDEIHCDLVYPNYKHIPIASLSTNIAEQTLTFTSPTKTFNIAGLQISYAIIKNREKRRKFMQELKKFGLHSLNTMGIYALEAAYDYGEHWLDQLIQTLEGNKQYVCRNISKNTDKLNIIDAEGTYLLWIDCRKLNLNSEQLRSFMINQAKVGLNAGIDYGEEGAKFMRLNIACPKQTLQEGVNRILHAVNQL